MTTLTICPDCNEDLLPNASQCKCGWRAKPVRSIATAGQRAQARDPDWWRCSNYDRGERCAEAGVISPSTHGGGPWLCFDHYHSARGQASRAAPQGGFAPLRAIVAKVAPKPPSEDDIEAAAERAAIQGE